MYLTGLHSISERQGEQFKEDSRLMLPVRAPQATLAALLASPSGNGDMASCGHLRQDVVTSTTTATVTVTTQSINTNEKLPVEIEGRIRRIEYYR